MPVQTIERRPPPRLGPAIAILDTPPLSLVRPCIKARRHLLDSLLAHHDCLPSPMSSHPAKDELSMASLTRPAAEQPRASAKDIGLGDDLVAAATGPVPSSTHAATSRPGVLGSAGLSPARGPHGETHQRSRSRSIQLQLGKPTAAERRFSDAPSPRVRRASTHINTPLARVVENRAMKHSAPHLPMPMPLPQGDSEWKTLLTTFPTRAYSTSLTSLCNTT